MSTEIKWYSIGDLYTIQDYKLKHRKDPVTKWIKLPCVYKIKINNTVVHVGRSDTCKKHGGAEKTRKAIVQLMGWETNNPGINTTKLWESIKKTHKPKIGDIKIGIIATNDIEKVYNKEAI